MYSWQECCKSKLMLTIITGYYHITIIIFHTIDTIAHHYFVAFMYMTPIYIYSETSLSGHLSNKATSS